MKYSDWQKLPSGGMWRRDPSTMRFIGLKGSKSTETTSGTMDNDEGSFGTLKTTSGSLETTLGSIGTYKTTSASLGTTKTMSASLGTTMMVSASLGTTKTTSTSSETTKMTLELLETTKTTPESIKTMPGTMGTPIGTLADPLRASGTIQRSSGLIVATEQTPRMKVVSNCTTHSPLINHIIMLCGFESDSVFVEYINQQEWSELHHVLSISVTDVNAFHTTVGNNGWLFKERPLDKDLQVFKGFLLYCTRIASKLE